MKVRVSELAVHSARLLAGAALLVLSNNSPIAACLAGFMLYIAAFVFNHDLAHGSLNLPRRLNEWLLAAMSVPMLFPSHGMRLTHARHHARPLAPDDIEGAGARLSFWGAVLIGPMNAAVNRVESFLIAKPQERPWQVLETAASLLAITFALGSRSTAGAAWVLTAVLMQLTASVWASYLGHRLPEGAKRVLKALAWTRMAALVGLAFHEEHHRHPKVPGDLLRSLA